MSFTPNLDGDSRALSAPFGATTPSIPPAGRKPASIRAGDETSGFGTPSYAGNFKTPAGTGVFGAGTPYPSSYSGSTGVRSSPAVAFNERLRVGGSAGSSGGRATDSQGKEVGSYRTPSTGVQGALRGGFRVSAGGLGGTLGPQASRTPSRMPPNKSLKDTGPPSVMSLKTPSSGGTRSMQGSPMLSTPIQTPTLPETSGRSGTPSSARWVTVFGFPAPLENVVLRDLRRHGNVVRTIKGKGNWMHVMYSDQRSAEMAVYKGIRVIGGCMVGVVSCTEPEAVRTAEENAEKAILVASPGGSTTITPQAVDRFGTSLRQSPLRASPGLRTPASVRRDIQMNGVRSPQPQKGILSSLSEYVFGS